MLTWHVEKLFAMLTPEYQKAFIAHLREHPYVTIGGEVSGLTATLAGIDYRSYRWNVVITNFFEQTEVQ